MTTSYSAARLKRAVRKLFGPVFAVLSLGASPTAAQELASYQLGAGPVTFGLAVPRGAAVAGFSVGSLATQTDIKTRWPDGSIRFAIVSAHVPAVGSYSIRPEGGASGSFTPTWPSVAVTFQIGGVPYTASLPAFSGTDSWLNGPVAREARVLVTPTSGGTAHPLLQVIFDVRSYAAGGHRVDITVQNTRDVVEANSVAYDVGVSINGVTTWSKSAVTQYYLTRWRKTFNVGLTPGKVIPDFEPFYRSNALPRFVTTVVSKEYNTGTASFDILQYGEMAPYMMTPGGRAEIGFYPAWVAQYLTHKRDSQLAVLLAHGNFAGSWSMSITEPDGVTPIRLDNYPGYWLDGRGGRGHPNGPNAPRAASGAIRGIAPDPSAPDHQHLPALTYVPYLITGDRYYIDQLKLIAAWSMIATYPGPSTDNGVDFSRQAGAGILAQNPARGFAWPLRELIDCAASLPDNDPSKGYFVSRLQNNLNWLDNYARTSNGGPLEFTFWERNTGTGFYAISLWQQAYLAWAVDHAAMQGFTPTTRFRDRVVRTQVRFLTSGPAYPPQYGAPYYPRVGHWVNGVFQLFTTMAEVFAYNHGDLSGYAPTDTQPGHRLPQPIIGYYGPEARALAAMGVRDNIPGAAAALSWLLSYRDSGGASVMGDVNARAGFAIDFETVEGALRVPRRLRAEP